MAVLPDRTQDTSLYGAYTSGGFRFGAEPTSGRTWGAYGPGMPYAPHFTYSLVPPTPSPNGIADGVSVSGDAAWMPLNLAGVSPNTDVWPYLGAPYIPTEAGGGSGPSQTQNGVPWGIQFQCPTNVQLTLTGEEVPDAGAVIIFGYDFYGQPLQQMVDLPQVEGGTTSTNAAFYGVVALFYTGGNATADCTCDVGVGNLYGLPYVLKDGAHIINYSYTGSPPPSLIEDFWSAGDFSTPSMVSFDVRGLVYMFPKADGVKRVSLTYYVQGGDPNQGVWNQIGQGVNPSGLPWNIDSDQLPQPPSLTSLYGLVPYFTGTP